jgi:hypothetical protein
MYSLRLFVGTVLIGGLTLAAFPGYSAPEARADSAQSSGSSSRSDWSRRVLQRSHRGGHQTVAAEGTFQAALSDSGQGVFAASHVAPAVMEDGAPMIEVGAEPIEMMPLEGEYIGQQSCSSCGTSGNACNSGGGSCNSCNSGCSQGVCGQLWSQCASQITRKVTFFAGAQGFKGPVDQGANGNFGFHEGLNMGMPLGDPWGIGFQAGVQAVHSNFAGDQVVGARRNDRDQVFFTTGLFRRPACGGLQWGVVFDFLHDAYYDSADMAQVRAELSLLKVGCREIGFWGAFGVNDDDLTVGQNTSPVEPVDVYAIFYRRHFSGGGQGRVWVGLSNDSDTLFGTEFTLPLGTCWALENNFTYLLPKEGRGVEGQQAESWSVMLQLVWYPGRQARCATTSPYHPLLGVADNTWFLVNRP